MTETNSKMGSKKQSPILYVHGMHKATVAKWCEFIFGGFFYEIKVNNTNRSFEVILFEKAEIGDQVVCFKDFFTKEYIDNFHGFFGGKSGFNIVVLKRMEDSL